MQDNKSPKKTSNLPIEDKLSLNSIQLDLYEKVMKGYNAYSKEELDSMSKTSKQIIKNKYESAKRAIHVLKSKKICEAETNLLNIIFPQAKIGVHDYDWYLDLPKDLTLRKLNISKRNVIYELIERRLLPFNFFLLD